jgi:hypothetical protein
VTFASKTVRRLSLLLLVAGDGGCFLLLRREGTAENHVLLYGLRIGIVALSLAAWFVSQSLIGARGLKSGAIADGVHEATAPLHRYLTAHPKCADAVLIASSAFIDLFGLFLIGASLFGPSMRPFAALLILFIMRQICQAACALPAPPDMIWRYPGFPSLLVTYGVANDFFFSGHTAIAVLGAIEVARLCPWYLGAAAGLIACAEAGVVLVLRAHYTMDIFGAVAAAFCAAGLASAIF